MARFITGKELENVIYDIIWDANRTLLIVTPYIKLDDYFKKLFDKHLNNHKLHIIIVFGKNEENINKSLSKTDLDYFKKFLNISIIYVPNLHGKYYGNDTQGVITSINLHDYSFKNNIEFGVFSESGFLNSLTNNTDQDAWNTSMDIANQHEPIFIKRPVYEKKLLSKNYIKSDILYDITEKLLSSFKIHSSKGFKKLIEYPEEVEMGNIPQTRPEREREDIEGYCIRTGIKIPYNPKKPFTDSAYKSWASFNNWDYPENYCHKTGKPSHGKTSMRKPVL